MDQASVKSSSQEITKAITRLLDAGSIAAVVTLIAGNESVGAKLLIEESGSVSGSSGDSQLDELIKPRALQFLRTREDTRMISAREFAPDFSRDTEILLLFERIHPLPRLVVCGAGHVGAALAKLGDFVGYHTTLIDDRIEFVKPERFPESHVELVFADDWRQTVREVIGNGKGVCVAVVTRGHNQDEECMDAIMASSPDYIGLIGSKRRTNIVLENLRRHGVSDERLKSIRAPIGLDLGAVSPEEVALAIIAEIVAERRGGKGGSLSSWRRR
ncbi:MAG TPA: XdhC family protein [Pyrinomonadaceae bacterium]